jgi:hypothetical protein
MGAAMNQPGKLDTVAPTVRSVASLAPAPAPSPSRHRNVPNNPKANFDVADAETFFLKTDRPPKAQVSSDIQLQISPDDREADASRFSKRNLIAFVPGWSVSLVGHAALLIMLAFIVGSSESGSGNVRLDAQMVDAGEAVQADIATNEMEDESDILSVDMAALNSEASQNTADVFHDTGVDVSLMEGMAVGDALDGLAASGLTPIESSDDGGIQGNDGNAASFFGTKAKGSRFIFIIDFSDSMNEGFRWERALLELEKAMNGLSDNEQAIVLLYNFQTFPMFDIPPSELKLARVTKQFKSELKNWLKQQRPFGGTRPAHALQYSLSLQPDAIFLLSDGLLADNSLEVVAELNRFPVRDSDVELKVPIHTVSLGPDAGGAEVMKFIADTNEGTFNWVQ